MASSLSRQQPVHFIGIGGIGMSALALILAERGYRVSGSEPKRTPIVQRLIDQGIQVLDSQVASTIDGLIATSEPAPLVVVSTAIPANNPEFAAARAHGLSIWHRSDVLAALIADQPSIAVAGSHGKTTTSTVITTLLAAAGEDPTAVIGGVVPCFGSNGHAGTGRFLVAEADESDGSLVKFEAELGVITNLELDHTDHYKNLEGLIATMGRFAQGCGRLLANHDDPILREHFQAAAWWSVQRSEGVDFAALPVALDGDRTIADFFEAGEPIGQITLPLPGLHNLSNVTAALAACRLAGVSFDQLKQGLEQLQAPGRRFDFRGDWQGRQIVDDYAHHPSEVRATLSMVRLMLNSGRSPLPRAPQRLMVVFQPHRFSRTQEFLEEFAAALTLADCVLLAPVYSAGEAPIADVNSHALASSLHRLAPERPVLVADSLEELTVLVQEHSRPDDLVLAMGAGDVNSLWSRLADDTSSSKASCRSPLAA
ncbi:UDP-N-acetylmuramate--L-alanine ligase [Synechococcus sp. BS55D]|uniref:UDP-N-acetylmuramate--L-alanine ligase n=1 Tax=Synechococcus sp. BS55D TaxID=2055943 RepID=UPI00103CCB25|nr:UDP-N-acetylmuramate--L-alanine ligase [Synechococcus sp. BS55D]TCD58022.1 UDP-N-acetylmuramate--L-alanine ligase [Synechococcus sp. BS55D]